MTPDKRVQGKTLVFLEKPKKSSDEALQNKVNLPPLPPIDSYEEAFCEQPQMAEVLHNNIYTKIVLNNNK
jgi:hypothetical protein